MGFFNRMHWVVALMVLLVPLILFGIPITRILERVGFSRWWWPTIGSASGNLARHIKDKADSGALGFMPDRICATLHFNADAPR